VPWKESCRMEERMKFVARLRGGERMTDLCREFGISRKTGYKFVERFERYSVVGLADQRRAPARIPHRTSPEIAGLLIALRKKHPTWGPKKLRAQLLRLHPGVGVPAASTIGDLLKRSGLIAAERRRHRPLVAYSPLCHAQAPNDVWCVDFKGQFRLGNRKYCYPLTITDAYSRMLLACEGLDNTRSVGAQHGFEETFRTYGLPMAIRSDNGTPFASQGLAGLSQLSVWWLRLGIRLERIEPASPQQNGRHERMHRTLKAETTRPAGANMLQQQERFERFKELYNKERPHEALGQRPPAEFYQSSGRPFPEKLKDPEYPLHDLVVRVRPSGHIYIPGSGRNPGHQFFSIALAGQTVGLREIDDDTWLVSFLDYDLAILDLAARKVRPLAPPARSLEHDRASSEQPEVSPMCPV
jgi:transposase InsO family protein